MTLFAAALGDSLRALLAAHTVLVVAALIFVEELGVPSPVPSDLLMWSYPGSVALPRVV